MASGLVFCCNYATVKLYDTIDIIWYISFPLLSLVILIVVFFGFGKAADVHEISLRVKADLFEVFEIQMDDVKSKANSSV